MNTSIIKVKEGKTKHYFIVYRLKVLDKFTTKANKFIEKQVTRQIQTQSEDTTTLEASTNKITEYELHSEVLSGNKKKFIKLLQEDYDITTQDCKGNTILHVIALQDKSIEYLFLILDMVKKGKICLKALNTAINTKNNNEETPIQVALIKLHCSQQKCGSKSYNDTVKFCIALLKKIYVQDQKNHFILFKVFYNKTHYQIMKEIKKEVVFSPELDQIWKELQAEVFIEDKKFIKLLQKGYDIATQDCKGNTILHVIALQDKSIKYLFLILDMVKKGKICLKALNTAINTKNNNEETPIQVALIKLHCSQQKCGSKSYNDTVKFCIALLKKIHVQDQKNHFLSRKFYSKIYYQIMKEIKKEVVFSPELDRIWKELQAEVLIEDGTNFMELLQEGYDIATQDCKGNTILHTVALRGNPVESFDKILDWIDKKEIYLKALSAAINTKNNNGKTPIQVALIEEINKSRFNFNRFKQKHGSRGYDDTVKFCIALLEKIQVQDQKNHFTLSEKFYSKTYYKIMREVKNAEIDGRIVCSPELNEIWKELQCFSKHGNKNSSKNMGFSEKLILGGLTCAIVFSVLAGNMENAANLSLMMIFYVTCYSIYSKLENRLNCSTSIFGFAENPNTKGNIHPIEESQGLSNPRTILNILSIVNVNLCEIGKSIRQYF